MSSRRFASFRRAVLRLPDALLAHCPPGLVLLLAGLAAQQVVRIPSPTERGAMALLAVAALVGCLVACASAAYARAASAGLLIACALGAPALAWQAAAQALALRLDPRLQGQELQVRARLEEMPLDTAAGRRLRVTVLECVVAPREAACPEQQGVRVLAPTGPEGIGPAGGLRVGDVARLRLRLRLPHAPVNAGLFDAELRALEEGVGAQGTLRSAAREGRATPTPARLVEGAREHLRDTLVMTLKGESAEAVGLLRALVVGEQSALDSAHWELFNRTGVGHLMSISGLHITMIGAAGAWLVGKLWRLPVLTRVPAAQWLALRCALPTAQWLCGVLLAFAYALIAGWGIPAQRTCWMLAFAGLAMATGRARASVPVLCAAVAPVCLLDPWAPLSAGFWLSFGAVAALLWSGARVRLDRLAPEAWRQRVRATLREAAHTQWAATVALLPLGALFFSSFSLVGPLVNAVAIPLVSLLITPLALAASLLACLWPALAYWPLRLAATLGQWLMEGLRWIDSPQWSALALPHPDPLALALALAATAVILFPGPWPLRGLAACGLLPLLLARAASPLPGQVRVTAVDIGQGTAVLVETAAHRLLFDTGPTSFGGSDAGARLIVPWLRARGIRALDRVVISHEDADHIGGAASVLAALPVAGLATSLPEDHPLRVRAIPHEPCRRGGVWQWDGVRFEWLHPGPEASEVLKSATNAHSCVLRVTAGSDALLLTGDIERPQEAELIARLPAAALRASVLFAPHHGSATSSSPEFLDAVAPRLAVFQLGYRNRYHHPDPQVLERYRVRGIGILRSDAHGAITLSFGVDAPLVTHRLRTDGAPYWRIQPPDSELNPTVRPRPAGRERRDALTAPSSRRPSPRPRPAPGRRRASTETRRARRAVPASRSRARAASRRAAPHAPRRR